VSSRRRLDATIVEQVPRALRSAHQALTARLRRSLHREGLPFSRFVILRILVLRGPTTSRALADALGVTTANMPGLLGRLESDGFVRRKRSTTDRREILIHATPEGRTRFLRVRRTAVHELQGAFDGWSAKELRSFLESLRRFAGLSRSEDRIELKVLR
jgi:MarR family transcriptional regulator, organic hydroperoxide resistance regulator